KIHKYLI
ncbi:hypothetical protein, partial [Plasmodium yoelii yoelii]